MDAISLRRHARSVCASRLQEWCLRLACLVGIVALLLGLVLVIDEHKAVRAYEALAQRRGEVMDTGAGRGENDAGDGLDDACAAWVRVEGTSIDLPVAQATDDDPSWYLWHDLWDEPSSAGCPFVDSRCAPDSKAVVCYGHHMALSHAIFSDLHDCYRQGRFDELGTCAWATHAAGTVTLEPLCALCVDSSWEPIQRFEFGDEGEFHAWLVGVCGAASARATDWAALAGGASRAVTLVTCSSNVAGGSLRTLVVFVA